MVKLFKFKECGGFNIFNLKPFGLADLTPPTAD
jgi:hypothetical protein